MISKDEILRKIADVFVKEFRIDRTAIRPEAQLYKDLDLDSIDAIDLVVKLELEVGIKLKEDELRKIRTVQDVVDVIHRRLSSEG